MKIEDVIEIVEKRIKNNNYVLICRGDSGLLSIHYPFPNALHDQIKYLLDNYSECYIAVKIKKVSKLWLGGLLLLIPELLIIFSANQSM